MEVKDASESIDKRVVKLDGGSRYSEGKALEVVASSLSPIGKD